MGVSSTRVGDHRGSARTVQQFSTFFCQVLFLYLSLTLGGVGQEALGRGGYFFAVVLAEAGLKRWTVVVCTSLAADIVCPLY